MTDQFTKIEKWVKDRNIHTADPKVQMCKVIEEIGELATGINKNNVKLQKDSIGDSIVTLVSVSLQLGLDIRECIDMAYDEIKDRKGKLINGIFVKEEDYIK